MFWMAQTSDGLDHKNKRLGTLRRLHRVDIRVSTRPDLVDELLIVIEDHG